ncbi:hypothetical protein SAMN05443665_102611 [Actinomadura meyerae]|jgi:hypothetical protein|uniref:Uncharacterized protein n=1 Tax=Actinomadura meyerae TaxID=240840 RepID=A0A239M523_9ACTN|nr:hypothetical protein [Actinomadura meyerae]SNT37796.1 hypothetical protein SAMN05443665_102611 [Actinomadura meyerae]
MTDEPMTDEPMTDELGTALRGALATAAREAPAVRPGLLEAVETAHTRRRRRRVAAAALGTALLLGGTGAIGAVARSGDGPPPVAAPGALEPVPADGLGTPVKVRERWPDAVRTVPGRLPGGTALHPVALLDGDVLVGATWASLQRPDELWSYDLGTGRADLITDIVIPRGSRIFASDFTIARGQVVWWLSYRAGGRDTVEVWGAPLAGGPARKITGLPGNDVTALLIDGDDVVMGAGGAVYRAPLAGGAPAKVPGTDGFSIVAWPWIGSPASREGGVGTIRFESLRNLATGERRDARLAPFKGAWSCDVTWCVGGPASGVTYRGDMKTAVQSRDGKAGRTLPDTPLGAVQELIYGRYLAYFPGGLARTKTHVLYDVESGELLDTGIRRTNEVMGAARNERDPQHFFTTRSGTVLLDLSKIR